MNNRVVSYLPCTLYLLSLCKKSVGWRIHNVFSILFYIKYIRPQLDYITWIMVRSTYAELLMLLHLSELNINISHSTALNAFNVIHTYIRTYVTYVRYICTYIHTYMFVVVNFDALAQASDIQIERRQVVFLCWIQDLNPGSQTPNRQQTECPLTNRLNYRGSSYKL